MQSKFESMIESILNTMSAYIISTLVYYYIIPLVTNIEPSFIEANVTVMIFTIISILRNYIWRRIFNKRLLNKIDDEIMPWDKPDFITPEIGRGIKDGAITTNSK